MANMNYWDLCRPTYLENWPAELARLSIAQVDIPLNYNEALLLGKNIVELYELFDAHRYRLDLPGPNLLALIGRLDEAILRFPDGGFVRLGSRSPKDSWLAHRRGMRCSAGREAWALLTDCSERIAEDLLLAFSQRYDPHLWVRQWLDIPEWLEFRCLVQDRELVGISQYQYHGRPVFPEIVQNRDAIVWAIQTWFESQFLHATHLDSVVCDVFCKLHQHGNSNLWEVKLLEINPFFQMTDPCLFDWRAPLDRTFRYFGDESSGSIEQRSKIC